MTRMHPWGGLASLGVAWAASACTPVEGGPVWAIDTLHLEAVEDDLYALQTWSLYSDPWSKNQRPRHFQCAVLLELDGRAVAPCEGCDLAWSLSSSMLQTDCEDFDMGQLPVLTGLGLGDVAVELQQDDPIDSGSVGTWVEVDGQWLAHGWAFPAGGSAGTWGDGPWEAWAGFAWDLLGR